MAQSHQRPFSRRQLAVIAKIAFIEAMALSLIIPTISSTGEITTPITSSTGPINFLNIIFQNSTIQGDPKFSLTTPAWTTSQNESMIVVASSQNTFSVGIVTSVKDTLGDSFTLIMRQHEPIGGPQNEPTDLEVWIGRDLPSKLNSITVTWNVTNANGNMIQNLLYQNIASVGQSTGTANNCSISCSQNPSLSITASKSGNWILGTIATQSIPATPQTSPCPGQVSIESSNFKTRNKGCSTPGGTDGVETWVSDNATSLRNGVTITYQPTLVGINQPFSQIEIEFIPIDIEPQEQNVNLSTLCATTGDTCHINSVNRISGGNSLQTLLPNTAYCTGITTGALTITSTQQLNVLATYSALSTNITGAKLLIQVYVTSSVPSTSFGVGLCSAASVVSPGVIFFQTSGANGQYNVNYYSTSMNGVISEVAGTYYSFIEITPQNFAGHISMAQWGLAPNSQLTMFEIK